MKNRDTLLIMSNMESANIIFITTCFKIPKSNFPLNLFVYFFLWSRWKRITKITFDEMNPAVLLWKKYMTSWTDRYQIISRVLFSKNSRRSVPLLWVWQYRIARLINTNFSNTLSSRTTFQSHISSKLSIGMISWNGGT